MTDNPKDLSAQQERQAKIGGWVVLIVIVIALGVAMNQTQHDSHNDYVAHCKELGQQQWHGARDNQKVLDYIDECK
jgi:hypothetical protein